ncbi:MAG: hypothetical protein JW910_09935 [Anaerolineae bacterium]|nr:hypothetical protein [Anaerolineae bacterium]
MRNWQLTATDPLVLRLAADVRLVQTDYADDQIWDLALGEGQSPALALQTRYGGRCGLARLVPMWVVDERVIYETTAHAGPPVLRNFAPSYLRLTLRPAAHLAVQVELWAMESHAVGGRFTLRNESEQPSAVGFDLIAQIMSEDQEGEVNLLLLDDRRRALHFENVGNLQPVILAERLPDADPLTHERPKVGVRFTLAPGQERVVRWVHAGRGSVAASLALAHHWLEREDWDAHLKRLREVNARVPVIETGDRDRDAALAFSYKVLLSSFVGPTGSLPYPSFVSTRSPGRGFSPRGDGSDYYRQWSGQTASEAYAALPALAPVAPELAAGVLRNFLAVSGADGSIDWKPGLGGQRHGMLSTPLLAATALNIYASTDDQEFLKAVYPGLVKFFLRWFEPDVDRDGDGLPEWSDTIQSGFVDNPSFSLFRRWAQHADISKAEAPDLAAYLVKEARCLLRMADILGGKKRDRAAIQQRLDSLLAHLDAMWDGEAGLFRYRERDTHATTGGALIASGEGGFDLIPSQELEPANRLIVRVVGGRDHRPPVRVTLEGLDADGEPVAEVFEREAFTWYRGLGAATSERVYGRIDRVTPEGLSRVYTVEVLSVDWTREDATLLLPLWAGLDDAARVKQVIAALTDPERFWRPYGIASISAREDVYDPTNRNGSGGVSMVENLMLGEGLIDAGRPDLAADLLERLLAAQLHTLRTEHAFREAYNSDTLEGLGEQDYLTGIVPLHLLWRLMGFFVISPRQVWIGGEYALPWPVRVQHLGVMVERTAKGARITFPSGTVKRTRSATWRMVEDPAGPTAAEASPRTPPSGPPPVPPEPPSAGPAKTIRVPVQDED